MYARCTGDIDATHLRVRDQAAQMRQRELAAAQGVGLRLDALAPVRLPRRDERDVIDHLVARRPRPIVHRPLARQAAARAGDPVERCGAAARAIARVRDQALPPSRRFVPCAEGEAVQRAQAAEGGDQRAVARADLARVRVVLDPSPNRNPNL